MQNSQTSHFYQKNNLFRMFYKISRYLLRPRISVSQPVRFTLYRHRYTDNHLTRHVKKTDYHWPEETWKNEKNVFESHIDDWYKIQENMEISSDLKILENIIFGANSACARFDPLNETLASQNALKSMSEAELGATIDAVF